MRREDAFFGFAHIIADSLRLSVFFKILRDCAHWSILWTLAYLSYKPTKHFFASGTFCLSEGYISLYC